MGASIKTLRDRAAKLGYRLVKFKPKRISDFDLEIAFLHGTLSKGMDITAENFSLRKIKLAVARSPEFDSILDKYIKNKKVRAAYNDPTYKAWTHKTVIQDIRSKGDFKRYKLVERVISKHMNKKLLRILLKDVQWWQTESKS